MKIKADFVTNSSSTSFMFVFKGDRRTDLFRQMVKHEDDFKLHNEYGGGDPHVDVWDIIKEIDPILSSNNNDPYYLPKPQPTQNYLDQLKKDLKENEKQLKTELKREANERKKTGKVNWKSSKYTEEWIRNLKHKILKYEAFVKKGLNHCVEISFGDNDGIIQGGRIGMTMDYSGRNIKIDDDEFAVVVENCH